MFLTRLRLVWPLFIFALLSGTSRQSLCENALSTASRTVARAHIRQLTERESERKRSIFAPLEFSLDGRTYRCRLFVPQQLTEQHSYPLLLWFHGYGESGDDNLRQLLYIQD